MSRSFSYCLIRYTPDRGAGERINVGVVLHDPETMLLDVAMDERGAALSCAFAGFSPRSYRVWASDFRSAIRHVGLRHNQRLPLFENEPPSLSSLLAEAQSTWGAAIEASEERKVAAYAAPRRVLEDLYERYVSGQRPESGRARPQFSESRIWDAFNSALRKHRLSALVSSISVDVSNMSPLVFEHSIRIERWRAMQPVSFDLIDDESIKGKAARWAGLTSRMTVRDDLEGIFYLVAPPRLPELFDEYQSAVDWLRETKLSKGVVEVSHASEFASMIQEDLDELGRTLPPSLPPSAFVESPEKVFREVQGAVRRLNA